MDLTNVSRMTEQQVNSMCHDETAKPVIIMLYVLAILILPSIFYAQPKKDKKFAILWIVFAIFLGIVSIIIFFNPTFIQSVRNFFLGWF